MNSVFPVPPGHCNVFILYSLKKKKKEERKKPDILMKLSFFEVKNTWLRVINLIGLKPVSKEHFISLGVCFYERGIYVVHCKGNVLHVNFGLVDF